MKKFFSFLFHLWALFAFFIVIFGFIMKQKEATYFLKIVSPHVSSRFTGGEILETLERREYTLFIHKPVFEGIISERTSGFIQIDIEPKENILPPIVAEHLSGLRALMIVDTKQNSLFILSQNSKIKKEGRLYNLGKSRSVRIGLSK
jgi:hypothetical protein